MKERPILFSAPMVRAILEGRKTQTRRVVKHKQDISNMKTACQAGDGSWIFWDHWSADLSLFTEVAYQDGGIFCPYGKAGDNLWVRETFGHNKCGNCPIHYRATEPEWKDKSINPNARWYPSIHMPRSFSRIDLTVKRIRVERLQDISNSDAKAEGVEPWPEYGANSVQGPPPVVWNYIDPFAKLWCEINGEDSWASNPWVWVVEFDRVTNVDG